MKEKGKTLRIADLPLPLYLTAMALAVVCMLTDSLPANMVGALFFLITVGEGLSLLGNTIPVVRTYLGGSVILGVFACMAAISLTDRLIR